MSPDWRALSPGIAFAVKSTRGMNTIRFHGSEKNLSEVTKAFYLYRENIIYTNGDFQIYAYRWKGTEEQ
jgi:hypothetical protein